MTNLDSSNFKRKQLTITKLCLNIEQYEDVMWGKKSTLCPYGFHKYICFKVMYILGCLKHIIRLFDVPYLISS